METWYLVIGIGTLLIVTGLINNVAEAVERNRREKKLKILRLKRSIDSFSDFLEQLKEFDIPQDITTFIQNEIFVRLQAIQSIDRSFHGIEDLIAASKEQQNKNSDPAVEPQNKLIDVISEEELQHKISHLRNFTNYIQEIPLLAKQSQNNLQNYNELLVNFRFDLINYFYSKQAQQAISAENYQLAKDKVNQIIGTVALSGNQSQKVIEINEQATLMLNQIEVLNAQLLQKQQEQKEKEEQLAKSEAKDSK